MAKQHNLPSSGPKMSFKVEKDRVSLNVQLSEVEIDKLGPVEGSNVEVLKALLNKFPELKKPAVMSGDLGGSTAGDAGKALGDLSKLLNIAKSEVKPEDVPKVNVAVRRTDGRLVFETNPPQEALEMDYLVYGPELQELVKEWDSFKDPVAEAEKKVEKLSSMEKDVKKDDIRDHLLSRLRNENPAAYRQYQRFVSELRLKPSKGKSYSLPPLEPEEDSGEKESDSKLHPSLLEYMDEHTDSSVVQNIKARKRND